MQKTDSSALFIFYQIFLLVWILIGLGYLAMVFNFITRGLQSEKMFALEQQLAKNIKKTNRKLRKELRYFLNDYIFTETSAKPIYRERRLNVPIKHQRTHSCPDLTYTNDLKVCAKKRAISAFSPVPLTPQAIRKSDTDLHNIDKIKTFESNVTTQHNQLLLKVVTALANYNDVVDDYTTISTDGTIDYSEADTFSAPCMNENWKTSNQEIIKSKILDVKNPNVTVLLKSEEQIQQESCELEKHCKIRSGTLPPVQEPETLFEKLKRTIRKSITGEKPNVDIESQCCGKYTETIPEERDSIGNPVVDNSQFEDTSLSDFLRALSIINFNEIPKYRRKCGSDHTNSASRIRRLPIISSSRRHSLTSNTCSSSRQLPIISSCRRHSLTSNTCSSSRQRRFSENIGSTTSTKIEPFPYTTVKCEKTFNILSAADISKEANKKNSSSYS